ncbi:hypothetical protein [Micromonospora sp. NBC_00421]|uniref:hypothetical protein n=1 Tax=Micromonospora sp. NBC_00421 TaxID=2975976 RepID=UPI002E1DAAC4
MSTTSSNGRRKVRVSQWPDREIEVDDAEYADLLAQGLLVTAKGEPTAEQRAAQAAATPQKEA